MKQKLLANYAIKARQYSDAVARLGLHDDSGPEFLALLDKTARLQASCFKAGEEIRKYVEQTMRTSLQSVEAEGAPRLEKNVDKEAYVIALTRADLGGKI